MKNFLRHRGRLVALVFLLGSLRGVSGATELHLTLPEGLTHYWRAEDNTADSVGPLDGRGTSTMHYHSGAHGRAFFFLEDGSRLSLGGTRLQPPWTFAAWVWREANQNTSTTLLADGETAIRLEQFPRTGRIGLTRFGFYDLSFETSIPLQVWTHVTLVGAPFDTRLYINGKFRQSLPIPFNLPRAFLGGLTTDVNLPDRLVGRFDELMIFDRTLAADEVHDVFNFIPGFSEQTSVAHPGLALDFFRPDAHVLLPHHPDHQSLPMTVATWIRTRQSADSTILSKFDPAAKQGWTMTLRGGRLGASYAGPSGRISVPGQELDGGFIADGHWHYVAFVVDRPGGRLYVDGVQRGVRAWIDTPGRATNANDLVLGGKESSGSISSQTFVGQLDEFTLWNVALGERDLQINAQRLINGSEPGLTASLRMNEAYGRVLTNSTGLSPLAARKGPAPTNSSVWSDPDRRGAGSALQFDDPDATVTVAHHPAFNGYPLTLMTWFKSAKTSRSDLIRKELPGSVDGYRLSLIDGNLRARYGRSTGDFAGAPGDGLNAGYAADGRWHHAAYVVKESGAFLYLDGRLRASAAWAGIPGPATSTAPLTFQVSSGSLDHLSLWNMALDSDSVRTNRSRILGQETPGLVAHFNFDEGIGTSCKGQGPTLVTVGQLSGRIEFLQSSAPVGTPTTAPVLLLDPPDEGSMRVYVRGLPGYGYFLAGSQNLRDWSLAGVPVEIQPGLFQLVAPVNRQSPPAFLRALAP